MERLKDFTNRLRVAEQFSVARVLRACATGEHLDGLEGEVCAEAARSTKSADGSGPIIPWAALRSRMTRDLTVASDSALVATEVDPLDILRPYSIVARAGVSVLPNLTGEVALTRTSATTSVTWMGSESASASASTPTLASTTMTPKNAIGIVQISRRFGLQVNGVEAWMRRELARTAATVVDQAVLQGAGSSGEPTGIVNAADVGTQSGTSFDWPAALAMKKAAAAANAADGTIAFVGATNVRQLLEGRPRDATVGSGFIWQDNAIASCAAFASTLMPDDTLLSGPFGMVFVGLWGAGVQVESNPYDPTAFKSGITKWRVAVSCDVALGCDPAAFTVATSIT
jgi:hypothetical protein